MSDDGPSPSTTQTPAALEIDVVRHENAWTEAHISDGLLGLAVHAALAVAPLSKAAHHEVTIVLTNDAEIQALNRTWRGKDQPTNVLSFPTGDLPDTTLPDTTPLGDIVIAFETTSAEAADKAVTLSDHVSHLVVHGTLHLLGHDHLDDTEAEQMEDLERLALASLGITDPYADEMPAQDGNAGLAEIA